MLSLTENLSLRLFSLSLFLSLSLSLSLSHLSSFSLFLSLSHTTQMSKFHYSQVRVKFEDEDGSGPGVNRGFFAALANAIKLSDVVSYLSCSKPSLVFALTTNEQFCCS